VPAKERLRLDKGVFCRRRLGRARDGVKLTPSRAPLLRARKRLDQRAKSSSSLLDLLEGEQRPRTHQHRPAQVSASRACHGLVEERDCTLVIALFDGEEGLE